jgi:3'-5' exoribonuclease
MNQQKFYTQQPFLANAFNNDRFKGSYYLVGFIARINKSNTPFWEITLSDATGHLTLYCLDQACIFGDMQPQSLVDIEARVDALGNQPYFRCKFIQSSSIALGQFRHVSQLPAALCPVPHALGAMQELISNISEPYLAEFVTNVLLQANIGIRFIQCPASLNHHHNYAGGLLEHSVEVAANFAREKGRTQQDKDLAVVAALLHDIGKTQTLTPDLTRTAIGNSVGHDDLTLEICAAALKILSAKHQGYADHLRHVWTCATPGARYGFKAKTAIARKLQQYDRQSASGHTLPSNELAQ